MRSADEDFDVRPYFDGVGAVLAATANVVMQLAPAPVGHGVIDSKVESGQVMKHPFTRARTTFTHLAVAMPGTDEERVAYRAAVNGSHRSVRSDAQSPVRYNAFDPALQMRPGMLPVDRAAFDAYWPDTLATLTIDPPVRDYPHALLADQRRFDTFLRRTGAVLCRLPLPVRNVAFNVLLRDLRRRMQTGRLLV